MTAPTPNAPAGDTNERCADCDHRRTAHDHNGPCFHSKSGLPCSCKRFVGRGDAAGAGHHAPHAKRFAVGEAEECGIGSYVRFEDYEALRRQYDATAEGYRAALLAARREVEAMRSAATECADDLEAEIRNRYHYPDIHPAMQGKYERDIEPVLAVRAALAATPEEKQHEQS